MIEKLFVVLIGAPGSGKGTQAHILCESLNLHHLSTGNMIRAEIGAKTELGQMLQDSMFGNGFIPDELAILLIENKLKSLDDDKGFLLDGFPRTLAQAEKFEEMLIKINQRIDNVIEISVEDEVVVSRIAGRYSCRNCGTSYHDEFVLPKVIGVCDTCGKNEFIRRQDDSADNVKARLADYQSLTYPIIDFYGAKGLLATVDGHGSAIEVADKILRMF